MTATPPRGFTLSVVVPVFDEVHLLEELLRRIERAPLPRQVERLEIVAVDDGSTDGSTEILRAAAAAGRLTLLEQPKNRGKGAALARGIQATSGDFIVFQDGDLEYDPGDYRQLVAPLVEDGADVVYGSRFLGSDRRRVLYFRHSLGNRFLTFLSNLFTDLALTDIGTGAKAFQAEVLKSIPIRSRDFAVEAELTAKIAKRSLRVFEVPVSYLGRTYREGKKVGWRDGVKAVVAIVRWWLVDDVYADDEYGSAILVSLERTRRFNQWMGDVVGERLGGARRVLEIGAGIGNLTSCLTPRPRYVASDVNPHYLRYLRNTAHGKPYLEVARIDLVAAADFAPYRGQFDAVVCLNVLEHVADPDAALRNLYDSLVPGGRAVLYVPRGPRLYSSLDEVLGHRCRYTRAQLVTELRGAGFVVEAVEDFNRAGTPGWWWNGRIRRRRGFGRLQLKVFDLLVPLLRRVDRWLPWQGLGLVAVALRPADEDVPTRPEAAASPS